MDNETIHCPICGYDFGISVDDPYADPTCPECIIRGVVDEIDDESEMMTQLKCPKCKEFLETLETITPCQYYAWVRVTPDGELKTTSTDIHFSGEETTYRCKKCGYESMSFDEFLVKVEECQHKNLKLGRHCDYQGDTGSRYRYCPDCNCMIDDEL